MLLGENLRLRGAEKADVVRLKGRWGGWRKLWKDCVVSLRDHEFEGWGIMTLGRLTNCVTEELL